jgi:hypothetical protein
LKMVAWVTVNNPDPVAKQFQFMIRDNDLSDTYLCTFNVAASSGNKVYAMEFITTTDWEIIRIDMRPNSTGGNGLNFNNVNLYYRPNATFTMKSCIAPAPDETPTPPPETELVANEPDGHVTDGHVSAMPLQPEIGGCVALDWFNTDNWNGYLPTSEVQFVFDPFPQNLPSVYGGTEGGSIFDANGDDVADTLYDALSYTNDSGVRTQQAASLLREAVIAMLNDRYDSNHPESWWAVEIDTAEALAQGENAMLALAQQYALSNATCQ